VIVHRIIVFAHVLFAFLYFLSHGASVAVAYRVRRETSAERVRALLDLSWSTVAVGNYMFLATILCGVVLGFLGHWWSAGWIWLAIGTLLLILVMMKRMVVPGIRRLREAAGLALVGGTWQQSGHEASPDDLTRVLRAGKPGAITAVAVGGWAVILWLMMFKPF
jgi:hypothetical protein